MTPRYLNVTKEFLGAYVRCCAIGLFIHACQMLLAWVPYPSLPYTSYPPTPATKNFPKVKMEPSINNVNTFKKIERESAYSFLIDSRTH